MTISITGLPYGAGSALLWPWISITCDTLAERNAIAMAYLSVGMKAYVLETGLNYVVDGSFAWVADAAPFTPGIRIDNRTSDPASPAVGQLWLRTDL